MYLSPSETLTEDVRTLGAIEHGGEDLGAAVSYRRSVAVRIPKALGAGTYYLFAAADADSLVYEHDGEDNNLLRSSVLTVEAAPVPDLVVENLNAPTSAASGTDVTVSWTVRNAGTVATDATSWTDAVFLSTDPVLDESQDLRVGEVLHTGSLAAGASYDTSATVALPEDLAGDRYVIVRSDVRGRVSDPNPTDNETTTANPTTISLSPARIRSIQRRPCRSIWRKQGMWSWPCSTCSVEW